MKYKRILLKLSGESLAGDGEYGLSAGVLGSYASQIREIAGAGVEVGIVIGGGNIFRGMQGAERGFDRVKGDQMGMLATVINSLALESALRAEGMQAKVLTSICMEPVGEYYSKDKAVDYLSRGYVVIIGGGTSNPYFTTDSAAALRGRPGEASGGTEIRRDNFRGGVCPRASDYGPDGFHALPGERPADSRLRHGYARKPAQGSPGRSDRDVGEGIALPGREEGYHFTKIRLFMKRILSMLFAVLFCCGIASAQGDVERTTLLKKGMDVPEFSVRMLDGTTLTSAELEGKVVLVNFWATWCPPCRKEFTRLQKDIVDRFEGKDFVLLPVSIDDGEEAVREFMRKNGYEFPVAFDGDKKLYGMFAEKYVPRNFIIGKDGKIAFQTVGYTPDEFDEMVRGIEALLK